MLCRRACVKCVHIHKDRLSLRRCDKLNVYCLCNAAFKYYLERNYHKKADNRQYDNCLRHSDVCAFLTENKYRIYPTGLRLVGYIFAVF